MTIIPSYLETPPSFKISILPPTVSRLQELPFDKLSWEDFEKLCLRLVRLESDVEHCQLYGVRGQDQEGIDIYARQKLETKYRVYQCKREKDFGPAKIKSAVHKFLEGDWVHKTNVFVLCTTESLTPRDRADEIESQSKILKKKGITLLPWDSQELSIKLKDCPKLVDDFFGRAWVEAFCGVEVAKQLGKRLDKNQAIDFRQKLRDFYKRLFGTHDPGLPIISNTGVHGPSFEERVVIPDVYDNLVIKGQPTSDTVETQSSEDDLMRMRDDEIGSLRKERPRKSENLSYQQRLSIEKWLIASSRNVILGGPGSGKSTFLRYLAIDVLHPEPKLSMIAQKWGEFLPVWIPFAYWTKIISNPTTASYTIGQMLKEWLSGWSEERIWPLIEQALEDERLLLLVDGLDEWTNEQAAQIALDRLLVFEKRNVPVIITSRPHGFARFSINQAGWQIGELCDFSFEHQKQLAQLWFNYKIRSLSDATLTAVEIERKALAEADGFLNELQRSPDIRELAKVPLLLCLLIYLNFQNASLPQSRFKAYDQLIEHLISTHPKRRRTASGLTEPFSELSNDELRDVYASLAITIQKDYGSGVVDCTDAARIVEDHLKDNDQGLGLDLSEARKLSKDILEIGEKTLGLIVKKSEDELGFFHRAFQEYLAAIFLSSASIKEQLKVVENYCSNPQWREVILGLLHLNNRKEDVKRFIDIIKSKSVNAIEKNNIDSLISEIVFGDSNCSVGLAKELAEDIFKKIETEAWIPQRERLLQQVLSGLRSTKVKELVKAKLQRWFPGRRNWYRQYIFEAMGKWPNEKEIIEGLWHGLYDEKVDNKRAAAKALAALTGGDDLKTERDLGQLAKSAVDPLVRAAAIEALRYGWPIHSDLDTILAYARKSASPELRLVSIIGLIEKQRQTETDQEELFRLGANINGVGFSWREDVGSALMKGWPKSSKTKEMCLKSLQRRMRDDKNLEIEIAIRILLTDFQQDEDVVQHLISEIKKEQYPFSMTNKIDVWRLLSKNFRDKAALVVAVDEWIMKQKDFNEPEISLAALIGRTPIAKAKLLSFLDKKRFIQWPTVPLLEGWGIADADVHNKLIEIAYGPADTASWISHLLPRIIEDKIACQERLMEILRDPKCERANWVIGGLKTLNQSYNAGEIVEIVLEKLARKELKGFDEEDAISSLIVTYPFDGRVRNLAIQELSKHDGNISAVASVYGNDEEIRWVIIKHINPLPTYLRGVIARSLGEMTGEDSFVISLLKDYDLEDDGNVKTLASISYHQRLIESGLDTSAALDYLQKNIVCYGHDYEIRRQAFFCGLVLMDRLDVIINAKETIGSERIYSVGSIGTRFSENHTLINFILQHWNKIKLSFGDDFFSRLYRSENNAFHLWDSFCLLADEYSAPCEEAISYLENAKDKPISANILRFIGRTRPGSGLLLEYCIDTINRREPHREIILAASELIGTHFGGENDVLNRILKTTGNDLILESKIISLCEGWPESKELNDIFELVREENPPLSYPAYFYLICRKSSGTVVFEGLLHALTTPNRWFLQSILRPVSHRLKRESSLVEMIEDRLLNNPTSSEKASLPKFLKVATGLSEKVRNWCTKEVEWQLRDAESPEIGNDIFSGKLQPVVYSLLDVLSEQN